jgi:hypothetical protein
MTLKAKPSGIESVTLTLLSLKQNKQMLTWGKCSGI